MLARHAVRFDAKLAKAPYRLGMNLHQQKRDAEAIPELRRAAEVDPSDPTRFIHWAGFMRGRVSPVHQRMHFANSNC